MTLQPAPNEAQAIATLSGECGECIAAFVGKGEQRDLRFLALLTGCVAVLKKKMPPGLCDLELEGLTQLTGGMMIAELRRLG